MTERNLKPGRVKSGGRKKGTPNKATKLIKDAVMESFTKVGGADYLVKMAEKDHKAYATLLGKILPSEINATVKGDMRLTVLSGIEKPPGSNGDS